NFIFCEIYAFEPEYKIDGDEAARQQMAQRANGRRSVPEIFINNQHIGGCDDLYSLNLQGNLDSMLMTNG
ncbi:MAG: hypothetical protein F6K03_02925, partial [Kamptonema sp. SIO4C4]|nr:hypothetical protein [Kamptonema sp. SIO4C4]